MLPRELGGVVSPELKVYGTSNLRVIDVSIMPTVPSAHLQNSVYAIAEKGADMIKNS
jgi:choline dehydrogenase-like flavoprotein